MEMFMPSSLIADYQAALNRHARSSRARKGHWKILPFEVWRGIMRLDILLHVGFSSHLTLL